MIKRTICFALTACLLCSSAALCFATDADPDLESALSTEEPTVPDDTADTTVPDDTADTTVPDDTADTTVPDDTTDTTVPEDTAVQEDITVSEEIIEPEATVEPDPTIWDKPFNDYTPTEGYLLLLFTAAASVLLFKLTMYRWL